MRKKMFHPGMVPQIRVKSGVQAGQGGYVNGVYYPDMSGVCGTVPPTPTPLPAPVPSGGGYVNGVYYPDMSGTCV